MTAILITGGSGFLGSLVAATALTETRATLVLPVRESHSRASVLARIAAELAAEGAAGDVELARVITVALPAPGRLEELCPLLADLGVTDILHCAGCLSYFNTRRLVAGNVELTRTMLALGARLGVRRFVYLSTAYCSGFVDGPIPERLHARPGPDPTEYTRTKREAEWLVAGSGLPFVIVRPSIVVGDSRDGRYGGKPYGVYQLWAAAERYIGKALPPVAHAVAGDAPINFLHQDAFKRGFWAAYRRLPDGAVMHLVSREDALPTMRDMWRLWMTRFGGPRELHLYGSLADVPAGELDASERLWLEFTAVNSEIASTRWEFETGLLDGLRRDGVALPDATRDTLAVAQRRFVADSPGLQRFAREWRERGSAHPRIVLHGAPVAA